VLQGSVFGETKTDELECQTETGEDRAKSYQSALGLSATSFVVLGTGEEPDEGWPGRKIDLRAIDGQNPKKALPQHLGSELLFVSTGQAIP